MTNDTLDTLRAARDNLTQRGWCQDMIISNNGRVCAEGAVITLASPSTEYINNWHKCFTALSETIKEQYPGELANNAFANVAVWNDMPGRTDDEVLAMFDKTIARLEEQV